MICPDCGYEFPPPERDTHEANAANEGILTGEIIDTAFDVQSVAYFVHTKRGADENDPKTMRIDYQVELNEFKTEWVCPEHSGWARKKFEKWWAERSNDTAPETTEEAVQLADAGSISMPSHIVVRKIGGERFERIIRYTLPPEKPPAVGFVPETDAFGDPIEPSEYVPVYVEDVPF